MEYILSKDQILKEISAYTNPNWIWIEIWEMSSYEIQLVITVNTEEYCYLGKHKVIHICSGDPGEEKDICDIKKYGRSIRRFLKQQFPSSNIHSRLYY